jgi:hypothetical protein
MDATRATLADDALRPITKLKPASAFVAAVAYWLSLQIF